MPKLLRSILTLCTVLLLILTVTGSVFAAIVWQSTTTNAPGSPATSLTVNKPTGTVEGDFMLTQITFLKGSDITVTAPAGWTLVRRDNRGSDIGSAIYRKFATGSEPASYTWNFNQSVSANGGIIRYTGVDSANPIIASSGAGGDSGNPTATSITAEANSKLVAYFAIKKNTTMSTPSGMTERYILRPSGDERSSKAADQDVGAGATGNRTSTVGSSDKWVAQLVALRSSCTVYYRDNDSDNYGQTGDSQCLSTPTGSYTATVGGDCDDTDVNVNPGATEVCNGIDDNCDGNIDEGAIGPTWYADSDGDGYGDPAVSQQACSAPIGYVSDNTDCDDTDVNVNPGATEVCNGIDDNCDGNVDEGGVCGGGGGGGGINLGQTTAATCPLTLTVNVLGKITTARMSTDGVLCDDCLAFDAAKQNSWEAKKGTKLTLVDGKVPELIRVTLAGSSPPSGTVAMVGPTYELNAYASINRLTPSPISVSPLFSMTSAYDLNELPKNTSAISLAYYPNPDQGWLAMAPETGTVAEVGKARGTMNSFQPGTVLTKLAEIAPPAKFQVSNLAVRPSQAQLNQEVTISVNVANTGGASGDYSLELKVDGTSKATKQVTLAAGRSQTVNFTITGEAAGKHQVEVAGLKDEFMVAGSTSETNWWLIVGIITAVILALGILVFLRRRPA